MVGDGRRKRRSGRTRSGHDANRSCSIPRWQLVIKHEQSKQCCNLLLPSVSDQLSIDAKLLLSLAKVRSRLHKASP